jgi:hypothetical protein
MRKERNWMNVEEVEIVQGWKMRMVVGKERGAIGLREILKIQTPLLQYLQF